MEMSGHDDHGAWEEVQDSIGLGAYKNPIPRESQRKNGSVVGRGLNRKLWKT